MEKQPTLVHPLAKQRRVGGSEPSLKALYVEAAEVKANFEKVGHDEMVMVYDSNEYD